MHHCRGPYRCNSKHYSSLAYHSCHQGMCRPRTFLCSPHRPSCASTVELYNFCRSLFYSRSLSRPVQQRCSLFELYCYHNRLRLCPVCTHSNSKNLLLRQRNTSVDWSQCFGYFDEGTLGGGGGGGGGTQYRNISNTVREIGKYRTTVSKIDEILIPHLWLVTLNYLTLYPSSVFFNLKHVYTRNQPQPSRENMRSRIDRYTIEKPGYSMSYQFHHRVTVRNCVFTYSLKSSKYWATLDRRGQMNGNTIPWRIFFYRIPLTKRMKNRIPQGWMIPQYRTLKSKLPKYCLKKSSIP